MSSTAVEDRLAREARGGDQRALAKIFSDYQQPLYRYCLAIVGDRQEAEDALQETMIKVLRALPGETREIALRPWLYRIAHNESIDQVRRRREEVSLTEAEPAPGGGLAEQVEIRERLRQLISDLGVLPQRQRGALLMREAAGLDFDEIGAALGTSPAVARQTLYEARLGLREMDAGREMDCVAVTKALSDGDRRVRRRRDISAHLRDCSGCRGFVEEIDSRRADLAAIAPLPAVAAAALLHGVLGGGAVGGGAALSGGGGGAALGGAGATGAGGAAGAAGAAAKSIGAAGLLKGAATVAVVAAIGVGAADKGGLIHLGGHDPAPAPRSGSTHRPDEGAPAASSPAGATVEKDEANPRPASGAHDEQPKARHSLGPATAVPAGPRDRSSVESANPAPAEPTGSGGAEEPEVEAPSPEAEAPGNPGTEHPSGRGHEKQTPPSAAHGQETAAANHAAHEAKETPSGKGAGEHPAHPVHPTHPTHPPKPTGEAVPPPAEAAPPPVSESPPAAAAEHAANPPGQEK